jgi:3-hydroxyacyl-CoA dehydrogenase / enoyl-CoA hydratase / 3-hydroxybutyryl-CoA epimerase
MPTACHHHLGRQGKSMNVMSPPGPSTPDRGAGRSGVKGIILTSGKKDFAGGMDLNVIAQMRTRAARRRSLTA